MMDIRIDTTKVGVIQKGAFNKQVMVVAKAPLQQQLDSLMVYLTDNTDGNNQLALLLREFSFAEIT